MKMRLLVLLSMLCFLALPLSASATEMKGAKKAVPRLTAEQIVARNVKARGGLKRWRAVRSMILSGKLDAGKIRSPEATNGNSSHRLLPPGVGHERLDTGKAEHAVETNVELPFVMEMQRPRKMRLEVTFQQQTAVQVFDGARGWKVRPFLGHDDAEPYTPEELNAAAQQQELDGPLIDHAAKGSKVQLAGIEEVDGNQAYKLRLTLKNGAVRHVWVDARTFLDVKIDGSRRLDGKQHEVATYLRNYRTVRGVRIPFLLETSVEGVKDSQKIVIDRVVLNPKLDASRFAKPHA